MRRNGGGDDDDEEEEKEEFGSIYIYEKSRDSSEREINLIIFT